MAATRTTDTGAEAKPVELWLPNGTGTPQQIRAADPAGGTLGAAQAFALYNVNGGIFSPVLGPTDGRAPINALPAALQVYTGAALDMMRDAAVFKDLPATAIVAGTPATIWTPQSGKKFRLMGLMLSATVATSVLFKYGAGGTLMWRTPVLLANTPFLVERMGNGHMPGAANDALKLDVLANATVTAVVWGTEE